MSTEYKYSSMDGVVLTIMPSIDSRLVFMGIGKEIVTGALHVAKADVPAVAAKLLKAAGQDILAQLLADVMEQNEAALKRAAEKKLQERRDALASRFGAFCGTYDTGTVLSKAIDAYIELEDKLASRD